MAAPAPAAEPLVRLYGLLHYQDGTDVPGSRAASYLRLAASLARSVAAQGLAFAVLTNRPAFVAEQCRALSITGLEVAGVAFDRDVPAGIGFHSAHYKLDLFRHFASGRFGAYVALLDLDVVLLNDFPEAVQALFRARIPCVYDITDQVTPRYGYPRIQGDIALVSGAREGVPRWYGGEFIAGPPSFFARLADTIEGIWDTYLAHWPSLHHQGDEMLVAAALHLLAREGVRFEDIGARRGIGRWWSGRSFHPQRAFAWFEGCALLHLPHDKAFLAAGLEGAFSRSGFLRAYRRRRRRRRLLLDLHRWLTCLAPRAPHLHHPPLG